MSHLNVSLERSKYKQVRNIGNKLTVERNGLMKNIGDVVVQLNRSQCLHIRLLLLLIFNNNLTFENGSQPKLKVSRKMITAPNPNNGQPKYQKIITYMDKSIYYNY